MPFTTVPPVECDVEEFVEDPYEHPDGVVMVISRWEEIIAEHERLEHFFVLKMTKPRPRRPEIIIMKASAENMRDAPGEDPHTFPLFLGERMLIRVENNGEFIWKTAAIKWLAKTEERAENGMREVLKRIKQKKKNPNRKRAQSPVYNFSRARREMRKMVKRQEKEERESGMFD